MPATSAPRRSRARGGLPIEVVREKYRSDRDAATNNQIRGAAAIVDDLVKQGRVHGIIGIGGGTATLVATSIMKRLPFGMPKLMASPMAAHPAYIDKYVGTRDITMHHTVLDIVKMNPLLKAQIVNAVGAICGMVEMTQGTEHHASTSPASPSRRSASARWRCRRRSACSRRPASRRSSATRRARATGRWRR